MCSTIANPTPATAAMANPISTSRSVTHVAGARYGPQSILSETAIWDGDGSRYFGTWNAQMQNSQIPSMTRAKRTARPYARQNRDHAERLPADGRSGVGTPVDGCGGASMVIRAPPAPLP